jgi:hypothetical protein
MTGSLPLATWKVEREPGPLPRRQGDVMKTVVAGMLTTFLFAGSASALTLGPLNCVGVPPVGMAPTELSANISCPQFNIVGTLTSVTVNLTGSLEGTITLKNETAQTQNGSAATQVLFNFGPLAGFVISNPFLTVTGSTGLISVPPSATSVFPVGGSQSASMTTNLSLGSYIGAGMFDIPVTTNTFLLLSFGGGNVTATQLTTAAANATVTYEYESTTTVPEPATLTLLGVGLLSASLRRRRNR